MTVKPSLKTIETKLYIKNEYDVSYQDSDAKLDVEDVEWLRITHGIRTDVHRTCINCQARQLIKYEKYKDKNGKKMEGFSVPCAYINNKLPDGAAGIIERMMAEKNISRDRAKLVLRATQDPVAWCELMFGFSDESAGKEHEWYLRPYQKEQLRCTSRRMVIREGRRAGKTFAMALKLIYFAFNMKISRGLEDGTEKVTGPNILVVTPYQAQVSNIFEEIESLLKRNPELCKDVSSGTNGNLYVKTPFLRMEFANGAKISGFVSGVGSKTDGSAGGTMRGQSADIIYLDEMDLIPDEVLTKVILPILATRKGTMMIATSTPIGKRGPFFEWCKDDPTFKEDHLPSTVLPQWAENKDLLVGRATHESFSAEYMALFIEGAFGVFKPSLVYGSQADYVYSHTHLQGYLRNTLRIMRPERLSKVIGIDWNKNAGTEFAVVGYDPDSGQWIVLETVNISASEFSSVKWKEEVVRLNHKWQPDYIYADEGYGHTIIEDLKLLAHKVRQTPKPTPTHVSTAKLVDRLIAFNFSQRVELRSPIDGTEIVKSGKEFLVENAIRIFEDRKLWFSVQDDQLKKELLNYVVLRRNPTTNKPIYGPENVTIGDHRLDAVMLAMGGLYLQNSEFSPSQLPVSKPTLLSKETLEKRGDREVGQGAQLLEHLSHIPMVGPTALKIMEIVRVNPGAGSPGMTPAKENRVVRREARSKENAPTDESVYEHYKKIVPNSTKGYTTDQEHLYQQVDEPKIVGRRQHTSRAESRRGWLNRRRK
jgi:hypothetical protein